MQFRSLDSIMFVRPPPRLIAKHHQRATTAVASAAGLSLFWMAFPQSGLAARTELICSSMAPQLRHAALAAEELGTATCHLNYCHTGTAWHYRALTLSLRLS